ncbi:bifunctional metallophosphatase/5'-nucleotidase [Caldalkalibacillus mannanilyticus]|uniref:bifunctional metallophosphatase/5'-nucleotidase n=1 Tax=Caldalkalibacillus mannanilyticus TaxID=1418 RepID=UPI000468B9A5|nr:bifunctional UDP-sugar hydrolase/5'-nucleotidase [Caldalkalibacillus mannanilyticus]
MSRTRIHFIHTNDLHSHFINWPQTVSTIQSLKQELQHRNEEFLLLDIGDHLDRSHLITEGTLGEANIDLMNELGYDYITIGNNEGITFAKEQIEKLYEKAHFRVLVSNLRNQDDSLPSWLLPATIHEMSGKKIGVIGATINFEPFYHLLGWKTEDPFISIERQVKQIREEVDLILVLSHMGLPYDEELARKVAGIDVILGAHTHHLLENGERIEESMINQAGRSGEYVGHVSIEWDAEKIHIEAQCIPTSQKAPDLHTVERLNAWKQKALDHLNEQVTVLDQELEVSWDEESAFGNLLAEGLREWCNTSISLVNSGQILDRLHSGLVTRGDLLRVCPHPINPCIVTLQGYEIWDLLQRSLELEQQRKAIRGYGFRGKIMGMLSVDGLQIRYKNESLMKKRVIGIFTNDDQCIEKEKEYEIATIDMFTFSKVIPEIHQAQKVTYLLPEFIRDILANRLRQGRIESTHIKRWKCVEDSGGENNEIYK